MSLHPLLAHVGNINQPCLVLLYPVCLFHLFCIFTILLPYFVLLSCCSWRDHCFGSILPLAFVILIFRKGFPSSRFRSLYLSSTTISVCGTVETQWPACLFWLVPSQSLLLCTALLIKNEEMTYWCFDGEFHCYYVICCWNWQSLMVWKRSRGLVK